jgi:hypothetical protein
LTESINFPHEVNAKSPDLPFGEIGFEVGFFYRSGVEGFAGIAHGDDDLIHLHITCYVQQAHQTHLVGVFDDVGGGFIGGKLEGVDGLF